MHHPRPKPGGSSGAYAAASQQAVSKALLIGGRLIAKAGAEPFFFGVMSPLRATSFARSHDPISWERATEKSRST
ncbi:MAG TPA: hypothetical protein VNO84_13490 [Burkholderiaceae bacterium]|nr:hypothetical protein [Burkholderiaceae bacterium]